MELTGTAGRSLGRRIGAVREGKDRAAANDNRSPIELARGGVALGKGLGCDRGAATHVASPRATHQGGITPKREAGRPAANLE